MKTSSSNQSVLLVEDHQELAETVGTYLEACGYVVDYAADGLTAAHLAVTESYSVIVLDIQLPGMDGLEVCRRLREDAHLSTPVIMLTARDQLDDKLKGFDAGADDYGKSAPRPADVTPSKDGGAPKSAPSKGK